MAVVNGKLVFKIPKSFFTNGTVVPFLQSSGVSGTPNEIVVELLDDDTSCPTDVRGIPVAGVGSLNILFVSDERSCDGAGSTTPDENVAGLSAGVVSGIVIAVIVVVFGSAAGGAYAYKLYKQKQASKEMSQKLAKLPFTPENPSTATTTPTQRLGSWESATTKPKLHNVV